MLPSIQTEALAHGCAACGCSFQDRHRIVSVYRTSDVTSFYTQVELGIIGSQVRNFWKHLSCDDPTLRHSDWHMNPDLNHCIRCNKALSQKDMVSPVFQVTDPNAVNPDDTSDVGIALAERVYFVHADCRNIALNKSATNILYKP